MPSSRDSARLTFGIYPGSAAGSDTGEVVAGPPDDPARIVGALDELQGRDRHPLVVRAYRVFADADDRDRRSPAENPLAPVRYTGQGRSLDLVVQYQSRRGDTPATARSCGVWSPSTAPSSPPSRSAKSPT